MTYLVESNDTATFGNCSCHCWINFGVEFTEPNSPQPCHQQGCSSHCWTLACSPRMDPSSLE